MNAPQTSHLLCVPLLRPSSSPAAWSGLPPDKWATYVCAMGLPGVIVDAARLSVCAESGGAAAGRPTALLSPGSASAFARGRAFSQNPKYLSTSLLAPRRRPMQGLSFPHRDTERNAHVHTRTNQALGWRIAVAGRREGKHRPHGSATPPLISIDDITVLRCWRASHRAQKTKRDDFMYSSWSYLSPCIVGRQTSTV